MRTHTIDTATARALVEAGGIKSASIVGQPGGWAVVLKIGMKERPLGTQRDDRPRCWRSLDSCVDYLREQLSIVRLDSVDASQYTKESTTRARRTDSSERLKRAHEAAAYDSWLREQVQEALDDPRPSIPHDEIKEEFAARRAALRKRIDA